VRLKTVIHLFTHHLNMSVMGNIKGVDYFLVYDIVCITSYTYLYLACNKTVSRK